MSTMHCKNRVPLIRIDCLHRLFSKNQRFTIIYNKILYICSEIRITNSQGIKSGISSTYTYETSGLRHSFSSSHVYTNLTLIDVSTKVFVLMALANPKSHNLMIPSLPSRIFCGFMSRCNILCACR